jgi:hypothetical protein
MLVVDEQLSAWADESVYTIGAESLEVVGC